MSSQRREVLGTFSIAALDDVSGMLGVAVTSRAFSVGMVCPFVRAGVGAVATQSLVNPLLGPAILDLLGDGMAAGEALETALSNDPRPDLRQLNVVDSRGGSATFTGGACIPWCGGRRAAGYALGGNILAGEAVVAAMKSAFEEGAEAAFADRLIGVLEAGQAAGGDARGRQSAALLVAHRTRVPFLRLQVDDHPDPVAELRRLYTLACAPDPDDGATVLDFMAGFARDPAFTWPVDDAAWEAEAGDARARIDAD